MLWTDPDLQGGTGGLFRSPLDRLAIFLIPVSDRSALLCPRSLRGVEFPVALFDAASALVPGNGGADMVRASSLACDGNFLLRFAGCQGKDLVIKAR
jgi:hypothetical protein